MPYRYTNVDYLHMVMCYHEANYNCAEAARLYADVYGVTVNPRTILGAEQRFREWGLFMPTGDPGRPRLPVHGEENVLEFFDRHPTASTADAAAAFNMSPMSVWRILKRDGRHPYHFTLVQELKSQDYAPRVQFCQWLRRHRQCNILWTDESTFTRVGMFNQHNAHYWAHANPHQIRPDHFQTRFSLNVWAGVLGDQLIGPVFLDRLNGSTYLQFLQETLEELLTDVPLLLRQGMYFQQDGAPAHYDRSVRKYLTGRYGRRWIGRGGPVPWPARSPDLTPLDFHVWGRVKDLVYSEGGHSIESATHLRDRIINAFDIMRSESDVLTRVRRNLSKRAWLCISVEGRHFQQFL
ncbi:hypothetical protein ABMA27_010435 [Loxostege sticticalis]|uniref:Transposase n=1 Tax=Loxostege sticticalis TaxID=481309 RepID=A0ABR3H5Q9_LOXSC